MAKPVKYCRIVKEIVKCKEVYYVQLVFSGLPPVKANPETGEIKHPVGTGKVGLDIGTQTIGIASKTEVKLEELAKGLDNIEAEIRRVQRALERSRRATNPENYNADGTVKKGRRKWIRSKRYMQLLFRLKEL